MDGREGHGDRNNEVVIKLGDNTFQASAFNEHTLAAFKLWIVAATPGQAQLEELTKKLEDQNAALATGVTDSTT